MSLSAPAIRFKDDHGKDFSDWEEKPFYELLDDVLDFRGRTPLKLGMDWGGGDVKSLSANNVKNGYIDFAAECNLGSEALYDRWMGGVDLAKGDIVFTMEAPLGKALQIPDEQKYILSQRVVVFKTKKNVNNSFLLQLIWSTAFQAQLLRFATGSTAKGINQKSLKKVVAPLPPLPEQQKIADFLTAVDGRIGQLIQKKAWLTDYKKGVMQQLFTQAIRFKDKVNCEAREGALGCDHGNDFPDWEEKKLAEIASFHRGSALAKADLDENGEFECIHYGELFTRYNEVIRKVISRTNVGVGAKSHAGDILMPSSDVTPDGLAKASALTRAEVILGGDINVIRPLKDMDSKFLSYLINFQKNAIIRLVTGTTVKHLYNRDMATLILALPSSLSEQTKIADFLSAIDRKIEGVTTQITETQTFKRGLLQQMFV